MLSFFSFLIYLAFALGHNLTCKEYCLFFILKKMHTPLHFLLLPGQDRHAPSIPRHQTVVNNTTAFKKYIYIGSEKEDVIKNETVFMNCINLNSLKEEKQTKKKNKTCKMA